MNNLQAMSVSPIQPLSEAGRQVNQYLRNQINRAPALLKTYTQDEQGNKYLSRNMFIRIEKLINDFISGEKELRMVSIPGLRGVGKTTLLAQLFLKFFPRYSKDMLYISTDQVVNELGADLYSVFEEYQKILDVPFEKLDRNLFIFIDEIHFDKKWTAVLKSIYDRSKRIFVVCTGSSALSLQSTTDLARRVVFEKLYPMNFTEYLLLKTRYEVIKDKTVAIKFPVKDLKETIKNALFYSRDAEECFSRLAGLKAQVNKYWFGVDSLEIDRYLRFGTMPYALTIKDEQRVHTLTNQQIDRVVEKDLPELGKFDTNTLSTVKNLLLLVAGSGEVSVTNLARVLKGISIVTLINVLETLEKAEMLIRVYPYGSVYKKVRKPSKYHFMTPAVRHTLLTVVEGENAFTNHKGWYLEDIVALSLHREFSQKLSSPIFYDSAKGGADFILSFPEKKIAIEIGYGKKSTEQAQATLEKIKGNYGLLICSADLAKDKNVIRVPLHYFLLI
ncbi:MAG: ATP-binding protein [Patescibacteria group bacterium]